MQNFGEIIPTDSESLTKLAKYNARGRRRVAFSIRIAQKDAMKLLTPQNVGAMKNPSVCLKYFCVLKNSKEKCL